MEMESPHIVNMKHSFCFPHNQIQMFSLSLFDLCLVLYDSCSAACSVYEQTLTARYSDELKRIKT